MDRPAAARERGIRLGFALTRHCNLRCAHCIRDDVTSVAELDAGLVLRVLDEAREMFDSVEAGFTGGEPLLHREWPRLVEGLRERGVPYTFVSNGWHMARFVPVLDRHPPAYVRLSLSGGDEATHDAERGRGSFRRVLLATAVLASRRVPVAWSLVVDRRSRGQLRATLDLAREMGCVRVHYILPQPVPASAERGTDLPPAEWWTVRRELDALAEEAAAAAGAEGAARGTRVVVDYGAPFTGPAFQCETMALRRVYVDVHGRLSTCCQLSEYGGTETDVVASLRDRPFADAWGLYVRRVEALRRASRPRSPADPLAAFPCLRCARACGKTAWLRNHPGSPWTVAAAGGPAPAPLVPLTLSRRSSTAATAPT